VAYVTKTPKINFFDILTETEIVNKKVTEILEREEIVFFYFMIKKSFLFILITFHKNNFVRFSKSHLK
jgi:hypothetical protein